MGGLWSTYTIHLKLLGKHIANFLVALIELFSLAIVAVLGIRVIEKTRS